MGARPDAALAILREVAVDPKCVGSWSCALYLSELVRTAARLDLDVARSLVDGFETSSVVHRQSVVPARAGLAEAEGMTEEAAALFAQAADRFESDGRTYEEALARLGAGRCLLALGKSTASEELRRSQEFFVRVGAVPPLTETDALLERALSA